MAAEFLLLQYGQFGPPVVPKQIRQAAQGSWYDRGCVVHGVNTFFFTSFQSLLFICHWYEFNYVEPKKANFLVVPKKPLFLALH